MKRLVIFGLTHYLIASLPLLSEGVSSTACLKTGGAPTRNACGAGGLSVACAFSFPCPVLKGQAFARNADNGKRSWLVPVQHNELLGAERPLPRG